ncbi:MAG: hypothetical protein GYA58_13130 [Anaerolineaceae bacterium]|nr:hypothetical protein [Anaerolineaceae bacterium]
MPTIIIHLANEDAVVGEVENLPGKSDTMVFVKNPRRKDGKDLPYLEQNVTQVVWPMHKITLIEVVPGAEDEEIISFVRE